MRGSSITQVKGKGKRYEPPKVCSPKTKVMATTQLPLSPLNVNANCGHGVGEDGRFIPRAGNKAHPIRTRTHTKTKDGDGNGSEAVVWNNNAVFGCDGMWGTMSCSSSSADSDTHVNPTQSPLEVSSCAAEEDEGTDFSEERSHFSKQNQNPDLESTASTPMVARENSKTHPASNSCHAEPKRLQSTKKSLFSSVGASQSSVAKFSDEGSQGNSPIGDMNDHEIQEIEKEILRLTQKLGELRLQKAAGRSTREVQERPEEQNGAAAEPKCEQKNETPKKIGLVSSVGDEFHGLNEHDYDNSDKQRRGRVVPAKFLQHLKADQKPVEIRKNGNGRIQMSPKVQRKDAILGPSEHSRLLEFPGKARDDECSFLKFRIDSARKGCSSKRNVIGGEEGKCDRIHNKMRSLSLSPSCQRITNEKVVRAVSVGAKKPGITPLKYSETTHWLHCKKLFQESETNKAFLNSSGKLGPPQAEKHSSALRNARFVASRYGQIFPPSKDKGAQAAACSLSSLKNVHGKRVFQEDDSECMEGRINNSAYKRRSAGADGPDRRNHLARNGHPCISVFTTNSKTPQSLAARSKTRKTGSLSWRDSRLTDTPLRSNTRQANIRGDLFQEKESSKREDSANSSDLFADNQEKITADGTDNYSSSVGIIASPEIPEPDKLKLPRIKTMRFTAKSPRDSGCIKRAVDCIGKKSFFAPAGNKIINSVDKISGWSVNSKASSRRGIVVHEIKQILSFEGDEARR